MKKLSNPIFFTELSKRSPVLLSPLKSTCWLANREGLGKIKTKFKELIHKVLFGLQILRK
jgi:hypothetical protein